MSVPFVSNFILSSKPGKVTFVEPKVEGDKYIFIVRVGESPVKFRDGDQSNGPWRRLSVLGFQHTYKWGVHQERSKIGTNGIKDDGDCR